MEEVALGSGLIGLYNSFISILPNWMQNFVGLFLLVLFVVFYAILIWHGYRLIAKKNIINLDLRKYNKQGEGFFIKVVAGLLYFTEYLIILPILIFIGFSLFTILLLLLTEGIEVGTLLVISAVVIAAVRFTSYYSEDLSKELAKIIPLSLISIAIFSAGGLEISKVFTNLSLIPSFFNNILSYLVFIVFLEIILRFFDLIFSPGDLGKDTEEIKEESE